MSLDDLKNRAKARDIFATAERLGLKLRREGPCWVGPCPVCNAGDNRFQVDPCAQLFWCRECKRAGRKTGGDVIRLVELVEHVDFTEAVERLADEKLPARAAAPTRIADSSANLERAEELWREAAPIAGTAGANYLAGRGIDIARAPDHGGLRFHPRCPWERTRTACVVARFTDATTGKPMGLHRRPILLKEKPRSLGPTRGGCIRLWPDDRVEQGLVIGEGVETTLAAALKIEHRGTLLQPAWAAGSDSNVANFPVLPGIEALTILVDNDANGAGQAAAAECLHRWRDAGREVTALIPERVKDFNDVILQEKAS
jgi:phage/plasmid primase-like uncharacterized protein